MTTNITGTHSLFPEIALDEGGVSLTTEFLTEEFLQARKCAEDVHQRMMAICTYEKFVPQPTSVSRFFKKNDGFIRYECIFFDGKISPESSGLINDTTTSGELLESSFPKDVFAKVTLIWDNGINAEPSLVLESDCLSKDAQHFIGVMLKPCVVGMEDLRIPW